MARALVPLLAALAACSGPPAITPEPPRPEPTRPDPPPAARPSVRIVVTNAGTAPLAMDPSLGLEAIDVDGSLAPIGLHLPPYPCECACDLAECPCTGAPSPEALAPGASVERTWDGALRSIRRAPSRLPCHERIDPRPGRYVVVACDASLARCGTREVELPASEPIEIAIPEQSAPSTCDDAARVRRAARIALAAARVEGVDPRVLAICEAAAPSCAGALPDRSGEEPPDACAIDVATEHGHHQVRITPAARDGAPRAIEAWLDAEAVRMPLRTDVAATRWAVSSDGAIAAIGIPRQVSHTHGGDPARIGIAELRVTNRSDAAIPIALVRTEWLGAGPEQEVPARSIEPTTLAPRSTTVVGVSFEPQAAYATWHTRFASRITLDAGGRTLVATVEHHVIRRDPIRR